MDTKKLLIDETGEWNRIKHFHDNIVSFLIVFAETWLKRLVHYERKLK